jgi:Protein of unknown function (DUF3592)
MARRHSERPGRSRSPGRFTFVKVARRRHIGEVRVFASPYPLLLLAIWTGVLVAGDYVVLETSARQLRAGGYTTTGGEITRSDIGRSAIRRRGIDMSYSYSVNGVGYKGSQYRYDDRNGAFDYRSITNSFRRGSLTTVYYNPANPADSVLSPGLDGCDLLLMLFGIPLNIITVALWVASVRAKSSARRLEPAGGVRILQEPGETRVRLAQFSPGAIGFFGLAIAGAAAAMLIVCLRGFEPSLRFMSYALIVVGTVGMAVSLWAARRHRSGRYDLRIQETTQILLLPPADDRHEPLLVPKGEIVAVSMYRRVSHSPSGHYFSYVPALERATLNAQTQSLQLVNWGWTEKKARAFGDWLSRQLGVGFKAMY